MRHQAGNEMDVTAEAIKLGNREGGTSPLCLPNCSYRAPKYLGRHRLSQTREASAKVCKVWRSSRRFGLCELCDFLIAEPGFAQHSARVLPADGHVRTDRARSA